jgi:hypothetical protein
LATLLDYRRATIRATNDGGVYTANAGASATVTITALINGHPDASPDRFDGHYIYDATSPRWLQQRQVRTGGFDPATGILTVDPPWSFTPQLGDSIEITQTFPSYRDSFKGDTSYVDLINRALTRLNIVDRIALSITGETASVAAYPWLTREDRLLDILEPGPTGGLPISAQWRGARLRLDAETPVIEVQAALSGTQTLTLVALRPANTRIAVGGSWADGSDGLLRDTDEAVPTVNDVLTATLVEFYYDLLHRSPGRPSGNWRPLYALAFERAQALNEGRPYRYYDPAGLPEPAQEAA